MSHPVGWSPASVTEDDEYEHTPPPPSMPVQTPKYLGSSSLLEAGQFEASVGVTRHMGWVSSAKFTSTSILFTVVLGCKAAYAPFLTKRNV